MPILLQLQKLPWKGDGGWKNVSLCRFLADYGPPKMSLKLAV